MGFFFGIGHHENDVQVNGYLPAYVFSGLRPIAEEELVIHNKELWQPEALLTLAQERQVVVLWSLKGCGAWAIQRRRTLPWACTLP